MSILESPLRLSLPDIVMSKATGKETPYGAGRKHKIMVETAVIDTIERERYAIADIDVLVGWAFVTLCNC